MRNKQMIKKTLVAALGMALALGCAGCGQKETSADPVNIAFVVGITDQETRVNEGIEELSMISSAPGTDYAFIAIDGTPSCIGEPGTIADLSDRGYTDQMMERVRESIKADLVNRLEAFEPDSDEIDMAGAIQLGVRNIKTKHEEGKPEILVLYCSGRSTTGLINMVETPLYKIDVEASASAVAEKMGLDMSGMEVVFYCCGDVGESHPKLSDEEKRNMRDFYENLFLAMGVEQEKIMFKNDLPSQEEYQFDNYTVTELAVAGTKSGLVNLVVLEPEVFEAEDALVAPIVIPEEQVQYKPDTAEFLNPEAAAEAIRPVAEFLNEHEDVKILLYGTCAGDKNTENTLQLGKARAESVKAMLLKAGIDEARITAVSVRVEDDPYYQFGLGTGEAASVNRKTVMVDMSTDLAKQILEAARG